MSTRAIIAVPAYNEEKVLRRSVETLHAFAKEKLPGYDVTIVIADNRSEDRTGQIADELAARLSGVAHLRMEERGKGIAIRRAWGSGDADVYAFMDADLATDLAALPALLAAVAANGGIAIGSRALPGSRVERSAFRRLLSWGYGALLRVALGTRVSDAPCGFKAASAAAVRAVMPSVRDDRWFFDTEFVVRAERAGFRIAEVPVGWREERPEGRVSKVDVGRLIAEYCRAVFGLRKELSSRR